MMKKKTILFLEDERELLGTITVLLQDNGYDVLEAVSAEQALDIMTKLSPDLIIADIKLPGIDGFDFFMRIRAMEEFRSIPFVFLTAFNNLQAAMDAKKLGAAEYITKPFDLEHLISVVCGLVPVA